MCKRYLDFEFVYGLKCLSYLFYFVHTKGNTAGDKLFSVEASNMKIQLPLCHVAVTGVTGYKKAELTSTFFFSAAVTWTSVSQTAVNTDAHLLNCHCSAT